MTRRRNRYHAIALGRILPGDLCAKGIQIAADDEEGAKQALRIAIESAIESLKDQRPA